MKTPRAISRAYSAMMTPAALMNQAGNSVLLMSSYC